MEGSGDSVHTWVVVDVVEDDSNTRNGALGSKVTQRTSVFDRLSHPESQSPSYASVVGLKDRLGMDFFPLKDRSSTCIPIPVELTKKAALAFNSTVYGYFLGPRIPFPIVQHMAAAKWGKFGFKDAMLNDNGFFFFRFNDEGGSKQAIENGPLIVKGIPLFVLPWNPSKGLRKPAHTSCPIWVKLHQIPLVAFNKEGVSRIASALGIPMQMDACTADMCHNAWGRPSFAKVLMDVWAGTKLKRELDVVIPSLHGEPDENVKVLVEYLWEPSLCVHCEVFGHHSSNCATAKMETKSKPKPKVDAEGFARVERQKWRQKKLASTSNTSPKKDDDVVVGIIKPTVADENMQSTPMAERVETSHMTQPGELEKRTSFKDKLNALSVGDPGHTPMHVKAPKVKPILKYSRQPARGVFIVDNPFSVLGDNLDKPTDSQDDLLEGDTSNLDHHPND